MNIPYPPIFYFKEETRSLSEVSARILLFATLRKRFGVKELSVKCNGTLRGLIESVSKVLGQDFLNEIYNGESGKIKRNIILMINGRNIKDLREDIRIKDHDIIAVFPPLAGG